MTKLSVRDHCIGCVRDGARLTVTSAAQWDAQGEMAMALA